MFFAHMYKLVHMSARPGVFDIVAFLSVCFGLTAICVAVGLLMFRDAKEFVTALNVMMTVPQSWACISCILNARICLSGCNWYWRLSDYHILLILIHLVVLPCKLGWVN